MIEGEVVHRDSLGNEQTIRPGQVNLMTAGRGIAHTEDSLLEGRAPASPRNCGLPARRAAPLRAGIRELPELPQVDAGGWRATVLAGSALARRRRPRSTSPLVGLDMASTGPAQTQLPLQPGFECRHGAARRGHGGRRATGAGRKLYFAPGRTTLDARCDAAAQWLLLGGEPGEDILIWWNLVARNQAELQGALDDWNAGRFAPYAGAWPNPYPPPA